MISPPQSPQPALPAVIRALEITDDLIIQFLEGNPEERDRVTNIAQQRLVVIQRKLAEDALPYGLLRELSLLSQASANVAVSSLVIMSTFLQTWPYEPNQTPVTFTIARDMCMLIFGSEEIDVAVLFAALECLDILMLRLILHAKRGDLADFFSDNVVEFAARMQSLGEIAELPDCSAVMVNKINHIIMVAVYLVGVVSKPRGETISKHIAIMSKSCRSPSSLFTPTDGSACVIESSRSPSHLSILFMQILAKHCARDKSVLNSVMKTANSEMQQNRWQLAAIITYIEMLGFVAMFGTTSLIKSVAIDNEKGLVLLASAKFGLPSKARQTAILFIKAVEILFAKGESQCLSKEAFHQLSIIKHHEMDEDILASFDLLEPVAQVIVHMSNVLQQSKKFTIVDELAVQLASEAK